MSAPVAFALPGSAEITRYQGKQLHALLNRLRDSTPDRDDLLQFVAFAMARAPRSKSQLFQDLWALWVNGDKRGGVFVEVGAADGVHLSNTYLLETEMGWSGVLAEPNPRFHESLRRHRTSPVIPKGVYSSSGLDLDFLAAPIGEFSRLAAIAPEDGHEQTRRRRTDRISVTSISLNDLLAEAGAPSSIDYLSIDTEGSEFEILSALDFGRWRIRAITVEHNDTPARGRLYDLLTSKGYRRMWPEFSRWDDWYVLDDQA